MVHPLTPVIIYPFYLLLRWLLYALREIIWRLNGTRSRLKSFHDGQVKQCAQLLTVAGRYKFDLIAQSNKPEDFILYHDEFIYPEYVLKDEVSLYYVDRNYTVFVECRSGVSVWDLTHYSFSREAQYREAIKVVILSTKDAIQLADTMGPPQDRIVFLGNISRCGSTLICHMFQSTGHYVSYTEPSVLGNLLTFIDLEDDPKIARFITMTLTLLCKPSLNNPAVEGHVIKVAAYNTLVLQSLYKFFPDAYYLFVYRNPIPVAKSLARLVPYLPYTHLVSLLSAISTHCNTTFNRYHNRLEDWDLIDSEYNSPYRRILPLVLRPIIHYYSFLQQDMDISAVRFEDLIQNPEYCMRRIFTVCGIPQAYISRALIPLDTDAQENSVLSGARLKDLRIPEFTDQDREQMRRVCTHYGIPDILISKVYPNTITTITSKGYGKR